MNRTDVEFNAEGTTLRGWLYRPEGDGPVPGVVMAHGFSATKEMYLDAFAEVFASAGLNALVFDNRNFGASDGEPRQEIDPWQQVRDYRHAVTWLRGQPNINRDEIGVWGSSYSGGHVLVLGAIDRRIKCVVSQVPLVTGWRNVQRLVRSDLIAQVRAQCDADREASTEAITDEETWALLTSGRLSPLEAFALGRMRVRGDLRAASRLARQLYHREP